MQNIINANQKSTTEQLYNDIGTVVPFYKEAPSYPALGIQFHSQYPTIPVTGAIANKSALIDLPSGAGFLYNMSVAMLCTGTLAAGDVAAGVFPGLNIIRAYQFESGGKILVYKTKNAIYTALKQEQNETFKLFSFANARALNPTTELDAVATDTSYLTYLPILESFLSRPEKNLLLDNMKDLKLRIIFDTTAASGLVNAITALTCYIVAQSYAPKMSIFTEMKAKDWSKKFVMEMNNNDEEIFPLTSATTTRLNINTPFLVSKTHVLIRKINNAATTTASHVSGLPTWRIQTLALNLNGTTFLDGTILPSRLGEASARYGNSSLMLSVNTAAGGAITYVNDMVTIDWGILCGRNMNSGTAFFNELRGSFITLTYAAFPGGGDDTYTDYSAFLEHEYLQGAEYDPGNGGNGGVLTVVSVS